MIISIDSKINIINQYVWRPRCSSTYFSAFKMSSRQDKLIEQFLSDELDSDESIMYNSDADPEFIPGGKKSYTGQETSTSNTFVPVGGSDSDSDDISVEVSSSDEDCDLSDTDLWVDTEKDIPDFNFDSTLSGIKINVPKSARVHQ